MALAVPGFRRYLIIRGVSSVGDAAWWFGLSWEAASLGGGGGVGVVLAIGGLPRFLLTLAGGTLADRWGIRRTMIISDCIAGVIAAVAVGLWLAFGSHLLLLAVLAGIFGLVDAVYGPSSASFMRLLLRPEQLAQGASARQSSAGVANIAGLAVGATLVDLSGFAMVAAIDAVTFFVVAVGLFSIRTLLKEEKRAEEPLIRTMCSGFAYLWRHRVLRYSLARAATVNMLGLALINVGMLLRVQSRGWPAYAMAGIEVLLAAGVIVAGTVLSLRDNPRRPGFVVAWGFVVFSALLLLMLVVTQVWMVLSLAFLLGLSLVPVSALGDAIVQSYTPLERLGNVNGAMITVSLGAVPVGSFVLGWLSDEFSVSSATLSAASALVLASVLFAGVRPLTHAKLAGNRP